MEKPTMNAAALLYQASREKLSELNRALFNSNLSHNQADFLLGDFGALIRDTTEDERNAEIEKALATIAEHSRLLNELLEMLPMLADVRSNDGYSEYHNHSFALYEYHQTQQLLERFNPLTDTVQAVAEERVKVNAYRKANRKLPKDYQYGDKNALVRAGLNLSQDELDAAVNAFIEAHPMRFAVTTGRLTYL